MASVGNGLEIQGIMVGLLEGATNLLLSKASRPALKPCWGEEEGEGGK